MNILYVRGIINTLNKENIKINIHKMNQSSKIIKNKNYLLNIILLSIYFIISDKTQINLTKKDNI